MRKKRRGWPGLWPFTQCGPLPLSLTPRRLSSPSHRPRPGRVARLRSRAKAHRGARPRRGRGRVTPLACLRSAPRHSASARPPPPPRHHNCPPHAHCVAHRWPRGSSWAGKRAPLTRVPGERGVRFVGWPRGSDCFPSSSTHLVGGHSHGRQGNTTEGEVHSSWGRERGGGRGGVRARRRGARAHWRHVCGLFAAKACPTPWPLCARPGCSLREAARPPTLTLICGGGKWQGKEAEEKGRKKEWVCVCEEWVSRECKRPLGRVCVC